MDLLKKQYMITRVLESLEEEDSILLAEAIGHGRMGENVLVKLNNHTSSQEEILEIVKEIQRLNTPMVICSSSNDLKKKFFQEIFPKTLDGPVWWFGQFDIQFSEEEDRKMDVALGRQWLDASRRPVMILGEGRYEIKNPMIPFVVIPESIDRLPTSHPYFMGRFGLDGDRCGNFTVQNADVILIMGRIPVQFSGSNRFAREAHVIQMGTSSSLSYHLWLSRYLDIWKTKKASNEWMNQCRKWRDLFINEAYVWNEKEDEELIHPYLFFPLFNDHHGADKIMIARSTDMPLFYPIYQQMIIHEEYTRFFPTTLRNVLPFCRGLRQEERTMILFLGEKDLFRIQDLYTIVQENIPLIIMAFSDGEKNWTMDEDGFLQRDVNGEHRLEDIEAMVSLPTKIITSYDDIINLILPDSPLLLDIRADMSFQPCPIGSSDRPLEDMIPLINEASFRSIMVIEPITRT